MYSLPFHLVIKSYLEYSSFYITTPRGFIGNMRRRKSLTTIIAETQYGRVQGVQEGAVNVWRGIPFARPPLEERRFGLPEPPLAWKGVRNTTRFGQGCVQVEARDILDFAAVPPDQQSEDCLSLNVWSPKSHISPCPVMVWIHGGSFVMGSGGLPVYDGASFAKQGGLVVVTINYRLGPFGFLYLGEKFGNDREKYTGNAGLLDQVAALQWVHDNIAAFGGDPNRVTVAGESAGAMSISALLTMPTARGLFHQVIVQSGVGILPSLDRVARTAVTEVFIKRLGLTRESMSRLYTIPPKSLLEASRGLPWLPMIDDVHLTTPFWQAIAAGEAAGIPVLVGFNRDEYRYFMDPSWQQLDDAAMIKNFEASLVGPIDPRIRDRYINSHKGELLYQALADIGTTALFGYPSQQFAALQSIHAPVWTYRFDWESRAHNGVLRACHAMELPFVFNTLDAPGVRNFTGTSNDQSQLVSQMHSTWIAFVRDGVPRTPEVTNWPQCNKDHRYTMIFNVECRVTEELDDEVLRLWEEMFN